MMMLHLIERLAAAIRVLRADETGATAVEYGVMVGLIAAVIIAAVTLLGGQVNGVFCSVVDALNVVSAGSCAA